MDVTVPAEVATKTHDARADWQGSVFTAAHMSGMFLTVRRGRIRIRSADRRFYEEESGW